MISNQNMCIQTRRKIIMKKKLFGLLAAVMAVSMTTSAFAADLEAVKAPRTAFNVDGSAEFSANDVYRVFKENPAVDVNGDRATNSADASVLYSLALQPKNVEAKAFVYADITGPNLDIHTKATDIISMKTLGYDVKADDYGTDTLVVAESGTLYDASKDVFAWLQDAVKDPNGDRPKQVSTQLDKVFFNSPVKGDVYLRSENGWAMLCYALRYIVPMKEDDARICNKVNELTNEGYTFATADDAQTKALDAIKAVVVGEQADPADKNTSDFTAADIKVIEDNIYTAFPNDLGATDEGKENLKKTAEEVLKITGEKYPVTITYNDIEQKLTADNVAESDFMKDALQVTDYKTVKVQDVVSIFGDKVTATAGANTAVVGIGYGLAIKE